MATVTFIRYDRQSVRALNIAAAYVARKDTTVQEVGQQLISGQNCTPQLAAQEFLATRAAHRKESPVWFYHYVQSFAPGEPITGKPAHKIAKELAARAGRKVRCSSPALVGLGHCLEQLQPTAPVTPAHYHIDSKALRKERNCPRAQGG